MKRPKNAEPVKAIHNNFLNPFMEHLRKKYICKNQIKKGIKGVREALNYLKKNYSIALMIDQRVSEGERINFFEKPALTTTLPAQLATKFNLKIITVFIKRVKNNEFVLEFQKEIDPSKFKNNFELTFKLNKVIEKMIVEKRYCLEILQQTRAITSAIKSLENNILNKHIDHCVVDAMKKNDKQKKQKIEELQDLLRKFNN